MQMSEARQIDAAPGVVWAALLDPEVLKAAVPGCEELTGSPEEGFNAVVVQKVGPVKARFSGVVTLADRVEGESLTLSGEGKGGAAGFARGEARVRLEPAEGGTLLHYAVDAKVGGKLAQLGSRIIDGFARKMADDFFARFQAAVEGPGMSAGEAGGPVGDGDSDGDGNGNGGTGAEKKGWFKRVLGKE